MSALAASPPRRRRTAPGHASGAGRAGLVRAVRAACHRRGMDDDDRHAVQLEVTGKQSLTDMTPGEIGRLLDHLNKGWAREKHRPHTGKIKALWWSLYWLGCIHDVSDAALDAFVKRQTGMASLRFLNHRAAPSVIEALKDWLSREGVNWPSDTEIAEHVAHGATGYDRARADRLAVLDALKWRLKSAGVMHTPEVYAQRAAGWDECAPWWTRTPTQLDAAIRALGKAWRKQIETAAR